MRPIPNRSRRLQRRHALQGVTIPELLMVVAIIAILMIVAFQGYGRIRQRAEIVDATAKLKNMHAGLGNYLRDKQAWPQEPENVSHEALWEWWMNVMKPYGLSQSDWFSNAHLRLVNSLRKQSGQEEIDASDNSKLEKLQIPSFFPTQFGDLNDAYEARYQPWVTESGEYHGDSGTLVAMPDGTVQTMPSLSIKKLARNK